jgi:hypothetical protein
MSDHKKSRKVLKSHDSDSEDSQGNLRDLINYDSSSDSDDSIYALHRSRKIMRKSAAVAHKKIENYLKATVPSKRKFEEDMEDAEDEDYKEESSDVTENEVDETENEDHHLSNTSVSFNSANKDSSFPRGIDRK